jgi:hypothetical protein
MMAACMLSAAPALAGGSAGAASFNSFFVCQAIDGTSVGQTVSIHEFDAADTLLQGNLRVGAGVLKCRQVNVKNAAGNFINGDVSSTELKCYSVSVKGPKAASEAIILQDDFFANEAVNASPAPQLLCGPALATQ